MSVYANFLDMNFDEARYQTIGRGHGFSELDGVIFKISEKYNFTATSSNFTNVINQLNALDIGQRNHFGDARSYSFELEKKVLENMAMAVNGS